MSKRLYLFTAEFPFLRKENFLEDEIVYLAKAFDEITLIPLSGGGTPRQIPANCKINDSLCINKKKKIIKGILGIWRVLPIYVKEYLSEGVYKSLSKSKALFTNMVICSYYMQSKAVRNLQKTLRQDDVVYFYWGVVYNTVAPFLKNKAKLVSRFHGDWDLWTPTGDEGYKPQRKALVNSLDCAVFISNKGRDFFQHKYPNIRTEVFHLGSRDVGVVNKSSDGILRIVSCSTVYPLKRVPLIFESVKSINNIPVEWTHIGGGPDYEKLSDMVSDCPGNLKVTLTGSVALGQVFEYYKNHSVDVFINLSTNEGVPVSIMEAISQNIPVVATNVGGNSEIVTEETGILVSSNPSPDEVGEAILSLLKRDMNPRQFWEREFNSEVNYSSFANFLKNL